MLSTRSMRNLRAFSSVLVVGVGAAALAVACSSNSKATPDAKIVVVDAAIDAPKQIDAAPDAPPNYDFSCEGSALPTTAATSITLSGTAATIAGTSPSTAPDVKVELYHPLNAGSATASVTSGSDGSYALPAQANPSGNPYEAFLKATKTGNTTTYVYAAAPYVADQGNIPVLSLPTSTFSSLFPLFFGGTQTAGTGMVAIAVTDCNNTPVPEATVTVQQGSNTPIDTKSNAQAQGLFVAFSVPPGDADIHATYLTHTWRVHTVKSYADSLTSTNSTP